MTTHSPRGPKSAALPPLAVLAALSSVLLLGGCRDEPKIVVKPDGGTQVLTGPGGAVVDTAADGASLAVPDDLPAFAQAYPGARLTTRISGGNEERGALLVFETSDAPDKVAAFYDSAAQKAGAKASMVVNESDTMVRTFGSGTDKREGAMIVISRDGEKAATEIVITAGMAEADVVKLEQKPEAWRETVRMPVRLQ